MKNEKFMAIVVVGLIAIIALQAIQIFAAGQPRYESSRTTGMASGATTGSSNMMGQSEQFNSVEEMMAAHHGTGSGGTVGSCGGH